MINTVNQNKGKPKRSLKNRLTSGLNVAKASQPSDGSGRQNKRTAGATDDQPKSKRTPVSKERVQPDSSDGEEPQNAEKLLSPKSKRKSMQKKELKKVVLEAIASNADISKVLTEIILRCAAYRQGSGLGIIQMKELVKQSGVANMFLNDLGTEDTVDADIVSEVFGAIVSIFDL